MKWYHGTNKKGLDETYKQGFLLHKRATKDFPTISPCTYLATTRKETEQYGKYILEVEYDPTINPEKNNYNPESWQIRVYEPIYKYKQLTK